MEATLPDHALVGFLAEAFDLAEQLGKVADAKDLEIRALQDRLALQEKQAAAPVLPFKTSELMGLLGDLQASGIIPANVDLLKVASDYQTNPGNILKLARVIQNPVPADGRPFSLPKLASETLSDGELKDPDGWLAAIRPANRR